MSGETYIWWFDKCHTKLGQSSDKEGAGTILFTKDWIRLLWEIWTDGRADGRTKLSNGAVSPLKNELCTGYMKCVFSVLAFDEVRSTYGMSEEVSSIYGDSRSNGFHWLH